MFDPSLLPPAQLEFVVIADTHYMLDPGDRPLEFESRRKQTARAEVALNLVASLNPAFVVHLGDLVQEYPETDRFEEALDGALRQLKRCGVDPHHVPGNHDIGDKPDPTMPTHPVDAQSLARYHAACGPSWYGFDHADCHFIVLNSQILNSGLPETQFQRAWLEQDLAAHPGKRTFLFLHLPPYLWDENEPGLGHYDNIDRPDRRWLLALVRRYWIEHMAAAHVHFAFFDRIDHTRYRIFPSPSFTRPGFSHLFTGPPPPEQGRDDAAKLGFTLFRVLPDRTDVHTLRTGGALDLPDNAPKRLITRTPAGLPHSPLGLTLCHPLSPAAEVPLAYPSVVRQRVRNDYPLLACLELGITSVRVPHTDLADSLQAQRLAILRDEGVHIAATYLHPHLTQFPNILLRHRDRADTWEIQLPGALLPSADQIQILKQCQTPSPLALAPIVPGEKQKGKQHPRTRIGYRLEELASLDRLLKKTRFKIDRVLCRIDAGISPWDFAKQVRNLSRLTHIKALDLSLELTDLDDRLNENRAAEACFAAALLPGSKLYVEPLIDLDRTLDVTHGLLDPLCNPRPPFHILRCLNTVLYGPSRPDARFVPSDAETGPLKIRTLTAPDTVFCLLLSEIEHATPPQDLPLLTDTPAEAPVRLYRLREGTVEIGPLREIQKALTTVSTPLLLTTA